MARLLACVTGIVNEQLLLQNEYLLAENRILSCPSAFPPSVDRSRACHFWPSSANDSDGKDSNWWPRLPNRTPFSPGFESSSLTSSMARGTASIRDARPSALVQTQAGLVDGDNGPE